MKRISFILTLALVSVFFSCEKVKVEHVNKVVTDTVIVDGSWVTGKSTLVDFSDDITAFGHCWATHPIPTLDDFSVQTTDGFVQGNYSQNLFNLAPGSTYYIRAFATNGNETVFGEEKTFLIDTVTFSINTGAINPLTSTTASAAGSIIGLNSIGLIDYGHCWSKVHTPTIVDSKTAFGALSSDLSFSSNLSGLYAGKNYMVKTYAKLNSSTVYYGNLQNFSIPELTVTTDTFNLQSPTVAILKGTLVMIGMQPITDHGFCWAVTTSYPTVNDNLISLGSVSSTGAFYGTLSPLSTGNTYYYRAYATDGSYIKYGSIKKIVK